VPHLQTTHNREDSHSQLREAFFHKDTNTLSSKKQTKTLIQ
jgi:hypothetical protein